MTTSSVGASGTASLYSTTSSSTKTYDKKDANKDGVVSAAEELAYDLKHPLAVQNTNATQETPSSTNPTSGNSVNLTA